jgi:hypothetical protein
VSGFGRSFEGKKMNRHKKAPLSEEAGLCAAGRALRRLYDCFTWSRRPQVLHFALISQRERHRIRTRHTKKAPHTGGTGGGASSWEAHSRQAA